MLRRTLGLECLNAVNMAPAGRPGTFGCCHPYNGCHVNTRLALIRARVLDQRRLWKEVQRAQMNTRFDYLLPRIAQSEFTSEPFRHVYIGGVLLGRRLSSIDCYPRDCTTVSKE